VKWPRPAYSNDATRSVAAAIARCVAFVERASSCSCTNAARAWRSGLKVVE
jgi:hypothetical protein